MPDSPKPKLTTRFFNAGIDWALKKIWEVVIMGLITALFLSWVFIRKAHSSWVFAALGFLGAYLTMIGISLLFALLRLRRQKAYERLKTAKFESPEKGYLDFLVDRVKARDELIKIYEAIAAEISEIADTSEKATARTEAAHKHPNPDIAVKKAHKVASDFAVSMDRHSLELERQQEKFEKMTDLLVQGNIGFITWLDPTTEESRERLAQERKAFTTLLEAQSGSLKMLETFCQTQHGLRGLSQKLNTTLNRSITALTGIISEMQKAERHWQEIIEAIDNKLAGNVPISPIADPPKKARRKKHQGR